MLTISILICLVALFALLWMLRRDRVSLGLPAAYLISLLLIHVPGAFAHAMSDGFLYGSEFVEIGIEFTALASSAFVCGVWLVYWRDPQPRLQRSADRRNFSLYCLAGGFIFSFALGALRDIPSVAAAVDQGGAILVIGLMLGLRASIERGNIGWAMLWLAALVSYPVARLLLGGFLSYGAAAAIIVCSVLLVSVRSRLRLVAWTVVAVFLGLTIFVNYF